MSGPSAKREQVERLAIIRGEQKLRPGDQQPTTLHAMSRLSNDLEGRASARDYVSGSDPNVDYPALPSGPWSSNYGRVPDEPPLNYSVLEQEPVGTPAEVAASIAALSAAASPVDAEVGMAGGAPSVAASPSDVAAPPATSSDGASAVQDAGGGRASSQPVHSAAGSSPTLHRPIRRL
jgi:hypothetical protein